MTSPVDPTVRVPGVQYATPPLENPEERLEAIEAEQASIEAEFVVIEDNHVDLLAADVTHTDDITALEAVDTANLTELTSAKLTLTNDAADEAIEAVATSDSPTVTWSSTPNGPSGAPDGYLKILVGATPFYIPYWA
jgi:hypothetical protein